MQQNVIKMDAYIERLIYRQVSESLNNFPAVAIVGPRQCGKSTLARQLVKNVDRASVYLDLENPDDRYKLTNAMLFFRQNQDKLICLDEIQRSPELFPMLRSHVDLSGMNGQFLILGSASRDLLKQSSESLAGRICYHELGPFSMMEVGEGSNDFRLIERGGFPRSYLATGREVSYQWRQSFITSFLERDLGMLGFGYPPETMRRLWQMLAHSHGQMLNMSRLGESLGTSHTMIRKYLDLLSATFMIRLLPPYRAGIKKRLVKTPKVYLRDSGILLSLLRIRSFTELIGNPVFGTVWEGYVLESIIQALEPDEIFFYRTSAGAEIDFLLHLGNKRIAVECKVSPTHGIRKGFFESLDELGVDKGFIVSPVDSAYPLTENVTVCNPLEALQLIREV